MKSSHLFPVVQKDAIRTPTAFIKGWLWELIFDDDKLVDVSRDFVWNVLSPALPELLNFKRSSPQFPIFPNGLFFNFMPLLRDVLFKRRLRIVYRHVPFDSQNLISFWLNDNAVTSCLEAIASWFLMRDGISFLAIRKAFRSKALPLIIFIFSIFSFIYEFRRAYLFVSFRWIIHFRKSFVCQRKLRQRKLETHKS